METHTSSASSETFTFSTWNIDQARREEDHEETKFDKRWPGIKDQIATHLPDILCLQELRNLETSSIKVHDLLHEISSLGYEADHAYYGPEKFSFALATFYKRDKFFLIDKSIKLLPLNKTKPNESRIVLVLKLKALDSKKEFFICNTHFDLDEDVKHESVIFLIDYLLTIHVSKINPFICAGDYNFFDDKDLGAKRNAMLEHFNDLAYPLSNASGTFIGFKHDKEHKPFNAMSRLDHGFSLGMKRIGQAKAIGDMKMVETRTYPSDHLMIWFSIYVMDVIV
jgi:endonuclease/exonuclease/phosphatase family metal-dependent hydrolase